MRCRRGQRQDTTTGLTGAPYVQLSLHGRPLGTKWNACYCSKVEKSEDSTTISFSTAWSPPVPVVKELAEQYPNLKETLRYWEGGEGFRGRLVAKGERC